MQRVSLLIWLISLNIDFTFSFIVEVLLFGLHVIPLAFG